MTGLALVLGASLGLGLWLLVSRIPILARPRLLHRVAPYVQDVSPAARELVTRERVDPARILGVVVSPLGDRIAPIVRAVLGSPTALERRLRQARSRLTVAAFRARQLTWAIVAAVVGVAIGVVGALRGGPPLVAPVLGIVLALVGAATVDWLLQRAAQRRMTRVSAELPTVLELMTLSLSAGEGITDALRRIARIGHGELAAELTTVVADTASGTPLTSALERLSSELGHPALTRAIEQMRGAIERGTSLAPTLQAQALDAREAAKRDLLEAAGRKEIAMLVPLVFGLLPITVAFALWPGLHVLQVGF